MRIGIDLGGTKIEGIAIADDGAETVRRRIPAPRGDYEATLSAIVGLVGDLERAIGAQGSVGVGIPGTISPATGLVKNANSTWLNGRPLGDDLPKLLGRPVRFANDANCFALSEATDGAAAGAHVVFGVIIGTGTGGGVVVNGRIVTGANAIGGRPPTAASVRVRRATADAAAASRRFCRDPASRGIMRTPGAIRLKRTPSPHAHNRARRERSPRSIATPSGWRARSRASSTS